MELLWLQVTTFSLRKGARPKLKARKCLGLGVNRTQGLRSHTDSLFLLPAHQVTVCSKPERQHVQAGTVATQRQSAASDSPSTRRGWVTEAAFAMEIKWVEAGWGEMVPGERRACLTNHSCLSAHQCLHACHT